MLAFWWDGEEMALVEVSFGSPSSSCLTIGPATTAASPYWLNRNPEAKFQAGRILSLRLAGGIKVFQTDGATDGCKDVRTRVRLAKVTGAS